MSEHSDLPVTPAPRTRSEARRAEAGRTPGEPVAADPSVTGGASRASAPGRGADIRRALERHDRRIGWMDLLRGVAILLVILHHSTQIVTYRIGDVPEFFTFLSAFFAPFRMPMLMFLSGLLVAGSLSAPTGKYVWGKVRRIVWPIIVWTVIYTASQLVADPQLTHMPWELGFWDTYLWFMQFIFAYYIVALLLRWVPAWLMVVVPFMAMFLIPAELELLQRFFYLMPFFFLGAFIEKHWDRYARLLSVPVAAALAVIPLGVALYSGFIEALWYEPLSALPAMLGILILVRLTAAAPEARWLSPVRFVGQYSLIYYVAHYPVFAALGWLAAKVGITSPGLGLVVIFTVTVAVATGFALIGRRMPASLLFELPRHLGRANRARSTTR